MTFSEEAKQLRIEVARLRPGRGRKYTPALRRRIVAWGERAKASGMLEADCSQAIGVPQHRFAMWREAEQPAGIGYTGEPPIAPVALLTPAGAAAVVRSAGAGCSGATADRAGRVDDGGAGGGGRAAARRSGDREAPL